MGLKRILAEIRTTDCPRSKKILYFVRKGIMHVQELVGGKLYLLQCDKVGKSPLVFHKPIIMNWGRIEIGDDVVIRSFSSKVSLVTKLGAKIRIGNNCVLNTGVRVTATQNVTIGNNVLIGDDVIIIDNDFHGLERREEAVSIPVLIEDDVWIAARAVITKGVHIGKGAVIGAGSVVTRNVEPYMLVGGVPAKPIRKLC